MATPHKKSFNIQTNDNIKLLSKPISNVRNIFSQISNTTIIHPFQKNFQQHYKQDFSKLSDTSIPGNVHSFKFH